MQSLKPALVAYGARRGLLDQAGSDWQLLQSSLLLSLDASGSRLWSVVLSGESPQGRSCLVQLIVGDRPILQGDTPPDATDHLPVDSRDSIIGLFEQEGQARLALDACYDSELACALVAMIHEESGRDCTRTRIAASNEVHTNLVVEERLELLVFHRLFGGSHPEVELALALDEAGFNHQPAPVGSWRQGGWDRAFLREHITGMSDGWLFAMTSLRDLYDRGGTPRNAGGDFAPESRRLGEMTARFHLAMRKAFGEERGPDGRPWIRVHGSYSLSKVARADLAWMLTDFSPDLGEGQRGPQPNLDQATAKARWQERHPAERDLCSMARSFRSAAVACAQEQIQASSEELASLGDAWSTRSTEALLEGYLSVPGAEELVPEGGELLSLVNDALRES